MSDYYAEEIYPWTVPILLPVAQISLTASVYTTVVTCFDRYIAICRPALLGKIYNHSTYSRTRVCERISYEESKKCFHLQIAPIDPDGILVFYQKFENFDLPIKAMINSGKNGCLRFFFKTRISMDSIASKMTGPKKIQF